MWIEEMKYFLLNTSFAYGRVLDSIEPREQTSSLEDWQDSNKLLARWHLAIVCKQKGCLQKHWPATLTITIQRENISFCDSCSLTMPSKFFAISNELGSWLLREPSHGFYLNCSALLPLTLRLFILPNHSSWKTRPLFRLLGGTTTSLSPPIPWFSGH